MLVNTNYCCSFFSLSKKRAPFTTSVLLWCRDGLFCLNHWTPKCLCTILLPLLLKLTAIDCSSKINQRHKEWEELGSKRTESQDHLTFTAADSHQSIYKHNLTHQHTHKHTHLLELLITNTILAQPYTCPLLSTSAGTCVLGIRAQGYTSCNTHNSQNLCKSCIFLSFNLFFFHSPHT